MVIIDAWMQHPPAELLADRVSAERVFGLGAGAGPASQATTEGGQA